MRVSVHQLGKAFGLRWALKGVDLELAPGDFVALLGANGAGKTTMLKLLAGLLRPSAGTIAVDGTELFALAPEDRPVIGFLSPGDHLYSHLTVRENLEFFAALYRRDRSAAAIAAALDAVGLTPRADEYVAALSSGMKCRLALAKWLLLDPGLLLLDEPYGVLDADGARVLESFLRARCRAGHIVMVASHHVPRVLELCTRAVILDGGRVIFDEPRREPWDSLRRVFSEFLPGGER
ncbi:MAG TPA: heme ABC exporter ATP-binding protein CcmA [candidate division Zixibacteria bacterium]|nr:heme ABC exporter ATP-binding protein CcmA [candidate division Zixibacteria bacterium]